MAQVKRKKKSKKSSGKTMAQMADKHLLYQASVQATDFEIEFYEDRYKELRGKRNTPLSLREDFCGTALLCADWCASNPKRTAVGVDLCSDTLKWGLKHNIKPAGVNDRVSLVNENVLSVVTEKMDVICAMNFSYCIFNTRDLMRRYFENVLKGLKDDGLFFMDLLGGTSTIDVSDESRELDELGATYIWEQESFNPINNEMQCYIHFEFDDGSRIDKAFSYYWRLWSIPEIKELLYEAGFTKVHVYWEKFEDVGDDDYLEGTGEYRAVEEVEQQESWLAYFVAEK